MRVYCDYISPDALECTSKAKWEVITQDDDGDLCDDLTCDNHLHKFIGKMSKVWPYEQ